MTQAETFTQLPPSPFIREFAGVLAVSGLTGPIVDLGCGQGRNSNFLARQGHTVIGVSSMLQEVLMASMSAREAGLVACRYVAANILELPTNYRFDAVIMNEVIHMLDTPVERAMAIGNAQNITTIGGLHAISGYVSSDASKPTYFKPNELLETYEHSCWQILDYQENDFPVQSASGVVLANTRASLIAQKLQ